MNSAALASGSGHFCLDYHHNLFSLLSPTGDQSEQKIHNRLANQSRRLFLDHLLKSLVRTLPEGWTSGYVSSLFLENLLYLFSSFLHEGKQV